jgi:hypothetical protein
MACALTMAVLHAFLLLAGGSSDHGHPMSVGAVVGAATSAAAASLAIIGVEITTALVAATLIARLRSVPEGPVSQA